MIKIQKKYRIMTPEGKILSEFEFSSKKEACQLLASDIWKMMSDKLKVINILYVSFN